MKRVLLVLFAATTMLVSGCIGGLAPPIPGAPAGNAAAQSIQKDPVLQGYVMVTAARKTAAQLLEAKSITVDQAQSVQRIGDQTRVALDAASAAFSIDDTTRGYMQLEVASHGLAFLGAFLKAYGGRGSP